MILGRITAQLLADVPEAVRDALGLKPGDTVGYEIAGNKVVMTRWQYAIESDEKLVVGRGDDPFVDPFALFTEWDTDADRKAFADL